MRKRILAAFIITALLAGSVFAAPVQAVSVSSMYIMFYLKDMTVLVGDEKPALDVPPTVINGSLYVPARFLGTTLGFKVEWDNQAKVIRLLPRDHVIVLDKTQNTVLADTLPIPFDQVAAIVKDTLMVKLSWIADYTDLRVSYNKDLNRVEVLYVKQPDGIYSEETGNSKPVAKFTTGKAVYRMGELVKYINLSYDPDAEGIASYQWSGREDVFFEPGTHVVTLQVKDKNGSESDVYSSVVTVTEEMFLSPFEYPIYTKPVGGTIPVGWDLYYNRYNKMPYVTSSIQSNDTRSLLVSDSPEEIPAPGVLYRDTVNGKTRLYADHINVTDETLTLAILATNRSDQEVTVVTTNKGEVWPSIYAQLIGNEATVDFLLHRPIREELKIPPGETYIYAQMPKFQPKQGANLIYDVETDGEVEFSFVASDRPTVSDMLALPVLNSDKHVRGTFPVSHVQWTLPPIDPAAPSRLSIGNGKSDPFLQGTDAVTGKPTINFGNWGVTYHIHIDHPPKMSVMVMAKGGYYKGPFKLNGEMVLVPSSGVLTPFDEVQILGRTIGKEESLDIEYSPPAGSSLPVDLVFYPLKDIK